MTMSGSSTPNRSAMTSAYARLTVMTRSERCAQPRSARARSQRAGPLIRARLRASR